MSALTILLIFLRLGLTSFGGPVAHLGYFRAEFVDQEGWFSDQEYADLVALCQFMPGPASSQVGFAIGYKQGGYLGALAAFIGFTLPSAVVMIGLGVTLMSMAGQLHSGMMQGLKVVAVAVVAQAVWGMARSLCQSWGTRALALFSAAILLFIGSFYSQFFVILMGAVLGLLFFRQSTSHQSGQMSAADSGVAKKSWGSLFWVLLFFILLFGLPVLPVFLGDGAQGWAAQVDGFYRSGALVFGGGHVVLPLLQETVIAAGWVEKDVFLAGYGAAQAMPGPLFTFAGFLGGALEPAAGSSVLSGWLGGVVSLLLIFLPGFLLILGVLPFWDIIRQNKRMQAALVGVNASVVGVLLAAFITPVSTAGIVEIPHAVVAFAALIALEKLKMAPWLVVLLSALVGWILF